MLQRTALAFSGAALFNAFANPLDAASWWQATPLKGRLKQSACRWCYRNIPLDELAQAAAAIGLKGIDLLNDPNEWPIVKKHGLVPTMTTGAGTIPDACNRKDLHDKLEKDFQTTFRALLKMAFPT
jgi:hydroxypyruvate isomerase